MDYGIGNGRGGGVRGVFGGTPTFFVSFFKL
jgi:hypothetical protein